VSEQGQPPQRIGDVERDRAVDLLREHMAAGRLTTEEFDERLGAALTARTSLDLDPLFTDLPGPRPGQGVATTQAYPTPPWSAGAVTPDPAGASAPVPAAVERNPVLAGLTAAIWPITLLLLFVLPHGWENFWWLIFVPIIISSAFGKNSHDRREYERRRIERQQRELDRRRRTLGD
jgi:hypothetical protein